MQGKEAKSSGATTVGLFEFQTDDVSIGSSICLTHGYEDFLRAVASHSVIAE